MRRLFTAALLLCWLPTATLAQTPTRTPTATPSLTPTRTPTITNTPTRTPTFGADDYIEVFAPESWVYDKTTCKGPTEKTFAGALTTRVGNCKDTAGTFQDCVPLNANYDSGAMRFSVSLISTLAGTTDAGELTTISIACQCGGSGDVITSTYGTAQTNTYDMGNVNLNGRIGGETAAVTCAGTCQPLDIMCFKSTITATDQPDTTWFEWVRARYGRN